MKCVRCGKENSTYVCDECRAKEAAEEAERLKNQRPDYIGNIIGIIVLLAIVIFVFKGCNSLFAEIFTNDSNNPPLPDKISIERYKVIDEWLMDYYENYYNTDNWYVTDTKLKYDKYIVVNLVAVQPDYVQTLRTDPRAAIAFAQTVCPNDGESIYNFIDRAHIDVDIYDRYGNFVNASSCSTGYR